MLNCDEGKISSNELQQQNIDAIKQKRREKTEEEIVSRREL